MNALDIMKRPAAYVSGYENTPTEEQNRAKQLDREESNGSRQLYSQRAELGTVKGHRQQPPRYTAMSFSAVQVKRWCRR